MYDIKYRENDKRADGSYAFESLSRYFDVVVIILRSTASSRTHLLSLVKYCSCNLCWYILGFVAVKSAHAMSVQVKSSLCLLFDHFLIKSALGFSLRSPPEESLQFKISLFLVFSLFLVYFSSGLHSPGVSNLCLILPGLMA